MKKKLEKIPRVLEERLLIDGVDRKLLKTIEDLSPYDSGNLYVAGNPLDRAVPTAGMIAEKVKMSEKEVLEKLEDIREKWNLPKNLPSNNNMLSGNDALIYTLLNQHKLRWDPKINDYRLKKIHVYTAEVGTGTLFTNNAAFVGEKIFRQAMDYNKMLNSYHIQGGVMPEIIAMFGKLKNQRALQTGLNQAEGEDNNEDELKKIKQILNLGEHRLTNRHLLNLKKYVINTIDSMEEAHMQHF